MTLKGLYALCFKTRASFGAHHENLNEGRLYCQRRRCSPMNLDSDNISFMRIFAVVLKIYGKFLIYACAPILRIHVPHAFSSSSSTVLFMTVTISANTAAAYCKVRTSEDVASGLAKCDPQSIWNPQKNCGSFVDAISSES